MLCPPVLLHRGPLHPCWPVPDLHAHPPPSTAPPRTDPDLCSLSASSQSADDLPREHLEDLPTSGFPHSAEAVAAAADDLHPPPSDEEVLRMMAKWDLLVVTARLQEIARKKELGGDDLGIVVGEILSFVQALLASMRNVREGVENDVLNNVRKIRVACESSSATTLEEMVRRELERSIKYRDSGREALLWLKRSLSFILQAVQNLMENSDESVHKNIIDAYNRRLSRCHHFFVRPIVRMYLGKLPTRDVLYDRLSLANAGASEALKSSGVALSSIVERLSGLCREFDLEHINMLRY